MCLCSNSSIPKIAKEDITVYKVLTRGRDCNTGRFMKHYYRTPYVHKTVDIRESLVPEEASYILFWDRRHKVFCIDQGMIHAYKNLPAAMSDTFRYNVIVKAVIPKGTEYFIGNDNDIAARKIVFKRMSFKDYLKALSWGMKYVKCLVNP